jgi:ABC-type transport system involved in multi-copper enzyme maturation permease subunit/ABC-type uncharacterized transport system involved in gliding motility auxiliary subunit
VRQILAISRREAHAFFTSNMAPVIATGFLVLTGLFYYLFVLGYADISATTIQSGRPVFLNLHAGVFHKLYGDVVLFLVFLLPAVTMRLVSPEYASGRYDLLASWPVPERHWILGKWISAMAVAKALLLGAVFYFVATWLLGGATDPPVRPDWQPMVTSLVGLIFLSAAIAAWGLAASALVEHQAAAYFAGFAMGLMLFLVGQLEIFLPGKLGEAAALLALGNHFLRFAGGVIDLRDVVYFVGVTAVGLSVAEAALGQRRLAATRRGGPWLRVLVVLAVAMFLQLVAERRPMAVDVTPDRLYSLAPQTRQILDTLGGEQIGEDGERRPVDTVEALAFYHNLDGARQRIRAQLQAFADAGSGFSFQILDPNQEPELVREYGISQARTVVLVSGGRQRQLLEPDEGQLAGAIYRLATDTRPVIYWLMGHGEARLDLDEAGGASTLGASLSDAGYAVRPLVLPERLHIPDDADLLVWAGPKLDPAREVLDLLDRYLRRGGALACFFGPDSPPAVRAWTERLNVRQLDNVVVAPNRAGAYAGVGLRTVTVVDGYTGHPAVRALRGNATTFPLVQTLRQVEKEMAGIEGYILLLTSPDTWAETDRDVRYSGTPRFDPDRDFRGPVPFGVALEVAAADTTTRDGRMTIVGSSGFLTNSNILQYANRDLVLNLVGWLAAEEDLLGIRGRRASFQPLLLTEGQKEWLGWVSVLGWPALVGLGWWLLALWDRRRRAAPPAVEA